ncbi:MAG TPA: CDP-alcohol phosphatidyltransferase family protein, partial [Bryobacteraceae bacterium]
FTVGNIFLGYIGILRSFRGAMLAVFNAGGALEQFAVAAKAIGAAAFLDGFDGLIARMTNTTSDFGREMDSLADVISFGLAFAILAFSWGVQFIDPSLGLAVVQQIHAAGYFICFLFLLCGSARLARFNVQKNPIPKNPGKPNRKYFVGMPIPAAAAMVASVVFAADGEPLAWWPFALVWLALLSLLGFLMVSTWRYYSFKGLSLSKAYSPLIIILLGGLIYAIWNYAQVVLVAMAASYVASGIVIRVGGIVRRRLRRVPPPPAHPEHQVG